MSRETLLRLVADRLGGAAPLPSAVEGLAEPHVPKLYFHDIPHAEIAPWIRRFDAKRTYHCDHETPSLGKWTVTRYRGECTGTPVELVVYVSTP